MFKFRGQVRVSYTISSNYFLFGVWDNFNVSSDHDPLSQRSPMISVQNGCKVYIYFWLGSYNLNPISMVNRSILRFCSLIY